MFEYVENAYSCNQEITKLQVHRIYWIKRALETGHTKKELADKLGVTERTITNWLNGNKRKISR
jgi:predicted transcriptional regulator